MGDDQGRGFAAPDVTGSLADALAASRTGTWRWDAASGEVRWDKTMEALSGLPPGGFGSTFDAWKATLHPDEIEDIFAKVDEAIANLGAYHFEHRTIWPDGTVRWLECRGQVTSDPDGTFTGTVGCAVDVTDRIETLERERRLHDRFQFLSRLTDRAITAGEHHEFMQFAAATAVPQLGDWCSIHFVPEPGAPIETVVAHADPKKLEWADELSRRFPFNPSGDGGVAKVLRTGVTDFVELVTPELIDENLARSPYDTTELREVVDELGLTSVITVPLTTKRGVLGAMQFVSAESGRVYDHDDVTLAQLAARRVADAIDNLWLTEQHQHISATLQQALLPPVIPEIAGVELAVRYWPAGAAVAAGGDFYDVFQIGPTAWSLLIGDVCGTGPDARRSRASPATRCAPQPATARTTSRCSSGSTRRCSSRTVTGSARRPTPRSRPTTATGCSPRARPATPARCWCATVLPTCSERAAPSSACSRS